MNNGNGRFAANLTEIGAFETAVRLLTRDYSCRNWWRTAAMRSRWYHGVEDIVVKRKYRPLFNGDPLAQAKLRLQFLAKRGY